MHNGAYTSLRNAIRHYRDPAAALENYDATQLDPALQGQVHQDPATRADIEAGIDRIVRKPIPLSDQDIEDLFAFLLSLTDPVALDQVRQAPGRVPSGLPVIN
jgi:cytochrome c peroxidase